MLTLDAASSSHRRTWLAIFFVAVAGGLSHVAASVPVQPLSVERLPDGNTLIADGGPMSTPDGRALEVDSLGRLVWAYVRCDVPFLHTARRLPNGNTLMSSSFGNKVIEVNRDGDRLWSDSSGLDYPNEAYRLANGNTLITDRNNSRVIEVTPQGAIAWSYTALDHPHNGSRLANGNTLICDHLPQRAVEVDPLGTVVWQYATNLNWPRCAERLGNGNTLIADGGANRVIEVDSSGATVWSASHLPMPYEAVRLDNGNTLVSAGLQVTELTPADSIVWQYPNTVAVVVETLLVVNPSSGCPQYVHIHRPANAGPSNRVPAVVFVPDGFGSTFDTTGLPDAIASDGFAFLHFDPDGRGLSAQFPYEENYDGYVHQDGMHACMSLLASRDYVDTSRLGVYTQSYGIAMGSGMIARYAQPRVKFLLDFEGPADRFQMSTDSGGYVPAPVDSEAFWQEREAARFIKQVPAAYLRFQPQVDSDSLIPDNRHAIQLIDSATAVAYGGVGVSPWTRVNDSMMNPSNRVYTVPDPPTWRPEAQESQDVVRTLLYLHELADKALLPGAAERRDFRLAAPLQVAPRPCRGLLQVGLPPGTGARELRVHDACGRLVARAVVPAGNPQAVLDLRDLQPGVYFASVAGAGTVPVVIVR